jgi:hypothetical protein
MDQPGVDLSLQGDTTEELANYAVVEFDNVADRPARSGLALRRLLARGHDRRPPGEQARARRRADGRADVPDDERGRDRVRAVLPERVQPPEEPRPDHRPGTHPRPRRPLAAAVDGARRRDDLGRRPSRTTRRGSSPRRAYDHPSRTVTISTDNGELNMVEAVVDYIKTSLTAATSMHAPRASRSTATTSVPMSKSRRGPMRRTGSSASPTAAG